VQTEEIVSPLRNHVYARNEAGGNAKNATGEKSPVSIGIDGDRVRRRRRPASPASARARPWLLPRPHSISSRVRPSLLPRARSSSLLPALLLSASCPSHLAPNIFCPRPSVLQPQSIPNRHESTSAAIVKFQARQGRARQGCSGRRRCPIYFDRWCSRHPC
jgi:hypothetical protein